MTAKFLVFIWIISRIKFINTIESCIYSNKTVTIVCSDNSNDDHNNFGKIDYNDCKREDEITLRFEPSEVATVKFQNCKRKKLPDSLSDVYKEIQTLDIHNMSLTEELDLTKLNKLTILLASHNNMTVFPKYPGYIEKINLFHDSNIDLDNDNLKNLDLSFNKIESVYDNLLKKFPNLEILNLSHNRIDLNFSSFFANARKLREIYLSHNEIMKIEQMHENEENPVEIIHLNDNKISDLSENSFDNFKKLKQLFLSNNRISKISPQIFKNLTNLIELNISSNPFDDIDSILPEIFSSNSKLQKLDLSNVKLKKLDMELFDNMSDLTHLDVSRNNILELSDDVFESLPKLEYLNLSNNELNRLRLTTYTFMSLKKLKYIYLSNTYLKAIPQQTFSSQTELKELDISGNNIYKLNANIFRTQMKQDFTLSIKNCRMKILEGFRKKSFPNITIIGIYDNDFNCTTLEKISAEFALDNSEMCPIDWWSIDKTIIWFLIAVNIILIMIIIGGIVWYKLRQRRIDPGFNLCHDYRQNQIQNTRIATINKRRYRPPKTTITEEENTYSIPNECNHLRL